MRFLAFIFVLLLTGGCEHLQPGCSPKNLRPGDLIAGADTVETFTSDENARQYSRTLSGEEARKVVQAVSTSERIRGFSNSIFTNEIRFFKDQGLFIGAVMMDGDGDFLFDGVEYRDHNGVLKQIYRDTQYPQYRFQ